MKMDVALEIKVDGELVYGSYSDGNVVLKHNPRALLEAKDRMVDSIAFLESFIAGCPTTAYTSSRE